MVEPRPNWSAENCSRLELLEEAGDVVGVHQGAAAVASGGHAETLAQRAVRSHALPVALQRVPDAEELDAVHGASLGDHALQAVRELVRHGVEGEELLLLVHGLPAVVQDHVADGDVAVGERLQALDHLIGRDIVVEGVPGTPAELVHELRDSLGTAQSEPLGDRRQFQNRGLAGDVGIVLDHGVQQAGGGGVVVAHDAIPFQPEPIAVAFEERPEIAGDQRQGHAIAAIVGLPEHELGLELKVALGFAKGRAHPPWLVPFEGHVALHITQANSSHTALRQPLVGEDVEGTFAELFGANVFGETDDRGLSHGKSRNGSAFRRSGPPTSWDYLLAGRSRR
jgi:hypothetical protein